MDHPLTIKQILKDKICPIGKTQLMKLIRCGEQYKEGTLPEWENYIIAINVGNGNERARWAIERSEIDAWLERAKSNRKPKEQE